MKHVLLDSYSTEYSKRKQVIMHSITSTIMITIMSKHLENPYLKAESGGLCTGKNK